MGVAVQLEVMNVTRFKGRREGRRTIYNFSQPSGLYGRAQVVGSLLKDYIFYMHAAMFY